MRPHDRELDDEIRGHLALSVQERIERGEDPQAARLAALQEFGYIPAVRDSMHRVWYGRSADVLASFADEVRLAFRSLLRTKGWAFTVVFTLALGIGANAAVFSVVRGVLLKPLNNRDENRLVYIRQSAPGLREANTTFSVPEIDDFRSRVTTISAFGDFSTVHLTLVGFGEPRVVQAGVVSGTYFEVMGLQPAIGRLLNRQDDGPEATPAAVLTHRFWKAATGSDPAVVGRKIRLGSRDVTLVGVLEPSIPYPADTEIIANVATSPHHLDATMTKGRLHRMTELFGRLAPGVSLEQARAELTAVHAAMKREHPRAYPANAGTELQVTLLRDQITSAARRVLILLLAAAAVVFVIACSNVANLILARSVRREDELAVRAALGASPGALRRTLLAEAVLLCGIGAALGIVIAPLLVAVLKGFAARFSVRALEVSVDGSVLWVGAALAMCAALLLAWIPRLPSPNAPTGLGLASGSPRLTPGTNRRLRVFATAQIAFSFVLLAAAATLLASLVALQATTTGYNMRQVVAFDLPTSSVGISSRRELEFYDAVIQRIGRVRGVQGAALGSVVPWRDAGTFPLLQFSGDGYTAQATDEYPHGRIRIVSPGFFDVLGVPLIAGRDFTREDRRGAEPVVIVSQSVVRRLFTGGDALNKHVWWTDPPIGTPQRRRIVGVVADVEDEHVVPGAALTIYYPVHQMPAAGRLFVHAAGDPYAIVPDIKAAIQDMSPEQPVERGATLEDVRTQVLAPERLNALMLGGFALVALLIAVVGVAGVLAFSVSARTREFGVRLSIGSSPRQLLVQVLAEGTRMVAFGIAAGAVALPVFAGVAATYSDGVRLPGVVPMLGAAALLLAGAVGASLLPAARASRVDVLQALRSE